MNKQLQMMHVQACGASKSSVMDRNLFSPQLVLLKSRLQQRMEDKKNHGMNIRGPIRALWAQ